MGVPIGKGFLRSAVKSLLESIAASFAACACANSVPYWLGPAIVWLHHAMAAWLCRRDAAAVMRRRPPGSLLVPAVASRMMSGGNSRHHLFFAEQCCLLAARNLSRGEVPIACVLVRREDGRMITFGTNRKGIRHAEIDALLRANDCRDWRLEDCCLYLTSEPCAMCHHAIVASRVGQTIFLHENRKCGAYSRHRIERPASISHFKTVDSDSHSPGRRALAALQTFFQNRRNTEARPSSD